MTQVLAVDDSRVIRTLLRQTLESEGYQVLEAADGQEALDALRAVGEPCVVLLDYYMPKLDGGAVLQTVAEEGGSLARHEFIVISQDVGTFPVEFIDLLRRLSIRIMPKPLQREAVVEAVAQAAQRLSTPPDSPLPLEADA
jgi:CheY-like chemotaxis protein